MKTAIEMMIERWESELGSYIPNAPIYKAFIEEAKTYLKTEKQQHEQTAIAMTNVFMDALDNPKGGKFSGEDEFNKYWDKKYGTTNKETLK